MSDWGSESDEEEEPTTRYRSTRRRAPDGGEEEDLTEFRAEDPTDYDQVYEGLVDDVLGEDDEEDNDDHWERVRAKAKEKARRQKGGRNEAKKDEPAYMFFDFRRGARRFPENVEVVPRERAMDMIEAARRKAEESSKEDKDSDAGHGGAGEAKAHGPRRYSNEDMGLDMFDLDELDDEGNPVSQGDADSMLEADAKEDDEARPEEKGLNPAPPEAKFDSLSDRSTALVIQPGMRLKVNIADLLEGGDANKEEREREFRRRQKRYAKWGIQLKKGDKSSKARGSGSVAAGTGTGTGAGAGADSMDGYSKWWKEYVNAYTITMDVKINEHPSRDGLSLFQTALCHVEEDIRTHRKTVVQSEGEALINSAGGVGVLGTFGDTMDKSVQPGRWCRVTIAVRCTGKNEKGELRTWVDAEPMCVLKDNQIMENGRFALDPDSLFLFSSARASMMPGGVSIRTLRVQMGFASDAMVKETRAVDKVISMFNERLERQVDEQRRGLSLAPLFAKPRPAWSAPTIVGAFGDAYIERTGYEGASCLAWSYSVLNYAVKRSLKNQQPLLGGMSLRERGAVSDIVHIVDKSSPVFKHMLRLLKALSDAQLVSYLRKLRKLLQGVQVGDSLLLPAIVAGTELLLLLDRTSERAFTVVIIQTDAYNGLAYHAVSSAVAAPEIRFRTCLVLSDIPKKNVLDDVFWMALYNMSLHNTDGDLAKFYDILLPFLTGKPLETSLVEAELANATATAAAGAAAGAGAAAPAELRGAGLTEMTSEDLSKRLQEAQQQRVAGCGAHAESQKLGGLQLARLPPDKKRA